GTTIKEYCSDPKRAQDWIRRMISEYQVTNYELRIRASTGRETDVSYNATTFRGTDGKLKGVFAAARDITEQRRLQSQLEQRNKELEIQNLRVQEANRLKSEFLANMSHELRTPLNGIIGLSEFIIDGKAGSVNDQQREYLGDVLKSGKHLLQLINDVLDLAKVESGRMDLVPETFSMKKALDEVCAIVRPIARKKNITIRTAVGEGVESVT